MRPSFEQNLEQFREEVENTPPSIEQEEGEQIEKGGKLRDSLEEKLTKAADRRGSHEIAQYHIYELQKEKQNIVNWRDGQLVKFDKNLEYEYIPQNSVLVSNINGTFKFQKNEKGDKGKITSGEIFTDTDWGIYYHLDSSINIEFRKRYVRELARRQIEDITNQQIAIDEISSSQTHQGQKINYQEFLKNTEEQTEEVRFGKIAEKMVKNFLDKITINNPACGFEIVEADIHYDTDLKIDFIIRRTLTHQPIKVSANHQIKSEGNTGIQFTTITDERTLEGKELTTRIGRKRLEAMQAEGISTSEEIKINDLIIVSVSLYSIKKQYERWNEKRTPGGPDRAWDETTKGIIFSGLLKGVLNPDEIRSQCQALGFKYPEEK